MNAHEPGTHGAVLRTEAQSCPLVATQFDALTWCPLNTTRSSNGCVCVCVCLQGANKGFQVCRKKMGTGSDFLCTRVHSSFQEFTDAVINLKFEEDPPYQK